MSPPSPVSVKLISRIVESVLGIPVPDAQANIIGLGANSMEIVRIINRLEDELGFRPRFEDLSASPSVAALAVAYDGIRTIGGLADQAPMHQSEVDGNTSALAPRLSRASPRLAIRTDAGYHRVSLPNASSLVVQGRSVRKFRADTLSYEAFSRLLGVLRQPHPGRGGHAAYASAGGCYAVQTYIHLRNGQVAALRGGLYYYHPQHHALWLLVPDLILDAGLYEPVLNATICHQASFAIYLVSRPTAILPTYGDRGRDYCLIEAGGMAQLLRMQGPSCGIGLCAIGEFDFEPLRGWLDLDPDQECLHSLLGGTEP
jgi:SagB-type dehydrogenase family enzyme